MANHGLTSQHAVPEAQERAVRLTGILMRNTDLRFRGELGSPCPSWRCEASLTFHACAEQVASKKFLSDLQDLATGKKVDPRVQDMVLRVLSPLAFDYQVRSPSYLPSGRRPCHHVLPRHLPLTLSAWTQADHP